MILPVGQQRAHQVGSPQHWRVARGFAAEDDVIAATGAGMAAIHHKLFRPEPRLAGFLIEHRRAFDQFVPGFARVEVYFDYAGVGCNGELVQARVARRRFAFNDDRQAQGPDGGFDACN